MNLLDTTYLPLGIKAMAFTALVLFSASKVIDIITQYHTLRCNMRRDANEQADRLTRLARDTEEYQSRTLRNTEEYQTRKYRNTEEYNARKARGF